LKASFQLYLIYNKAENCGIQVVQTQGFQFVTFTGTTLAKFNRRQAPVCQM